MRIVAVCASAFVALVFVGAASAACRPTANDPYGPNRGTPPLRAKIGTGHVLTGIVLSPACTPVAGARVSFWQWNARGVYTRARGGGVTAGRAGRFRFEGPRPTGYDGRPAHIH